MDTNKHESTEKVVGFISEHTNQNSLHIEKIEPLKILNNALSCISCLSWLKTEVQYEMQFDPNLDFQKRAIEFVALGYTQTEGQPND